MTLQLNNKGAASTTTDKTIGEAMGPYEESSTFFDRKETKVDKEAVDLSQKHYVDGLESIIKSFGTRSVVITTDTVDGNEGFTDSLKRVMNAIIQMAKDAVNWIISLINNKLVRLENRLHRLRVTRKRQGLRGVETNYPLGVRRLIIPNKVTTNAGWIAESIGEVTKFYANSVAAYKELTKLIETEPGMFNADTATAAVNGIMAQKLNMEAGPKDNSGSIQFKTSPLPSNRYFIYNSRADNTVERADMTFQDTNLDGRLKSLTFMPSGHVVDKAFDAVQGALDEVRKNQRTVSDLHRAFEKSVVAFEGKAGSAVSSAQRHFLRYLINHNRRMSQLGIQYLIASCDVALDFCYAGIEK